MTATVFQISISKGGVPKLPIEQAEVETNGLRGDDQHDKKHHGGPERAVCLFALEVIDRLRAEGHPIVPGSIGDNLTIQGIDWSTVAPGSRFVFAGGVVLEVSSYTTPCSTIRASFLDSGFTRVKQDLHAGESRVYARVIQTGTLSRGEAVRLEPGRGPVA